MVRAWTVRGGQHGEQEAAALAQSLVFIGWSELDVDLSKCSTRDDIRRVILDFCPGESPATVGNWAGQLDRFVHTMQVGDFVVMPRKYQQVVAIGQVAGNYEYRGDAELGFRHVRPVDWLNPEVDRIAIRGDLRDSIGSLLTVSELSRRDAVDRVKSLATTGFDPGYAGHVSPPADIEELRADIDESGTRQLSARDLIGLWGSSRRTPETIENVGSALTKLGLAVEPPFDVVRLDDLVTVFERDATGNTPAEVDDEPETEAPSALVKDLTWRIGNLRLGTEVSCVTLEDSLEHATLLMFEHEYSQLPIVDQHRRLLGVITWESVARAQLVNRDKTIRNAKVTGYPPTARDGEELFVRIPDIQQHGFVIVVDDVNAVTGILTAADLAGELKTRVQPFTVLEEIEQRLRRAVKPPKLSLKDLRDSYRGRPEKINGPEDLTLGSYSYLVGDPERWRKLAWPFERTEMVNRLKEVANYRNRVAHWDVDAPEDGEALEQAQRLLRLLKVIDPDPIG